MVSSNKLKVLIHYGGAYHRGSFQGRDCSPDYRLHSSHEGSGLLTRLGKLKVLLYVQWDMQAKEDQRQLSHLQESSTVSSHKARKADGAAMPHLAVWLPSHKACLR